MATWLENAIEKFEQSNFTDGDIVSHDWINWALLIPVCSTIKEFKETQFVLLHRLDMFRDYLLTEKKIALQSVRGEGYRIVPPSEQAYFAAKENMDTVKRALEKADKIMTHTRTETLTTEESKRHNDAHIRLIGINQLVKKQKRDIFYLFSKSDE